MKREKELKQWKDSKRIHSLIAGSEHPGWRPGGSVPVFDRDHRSQNTYPASRGIFICIQFISFGRRLCRSIILAYNPIWLKNNNIELSI
jgi:hypothetical protein